MVNLNVKFYIIGHSDTMTAVVITVAWLSYTDHLQNDELH